MNICSGRPERQRFPPFKCQLIFSLIIRKFHSLHEDGQFLLDVFKNGSSIVIMMIAGNDKNLFPSCPHHFLLELDDDANCGNENEKTFNGYLIEETNQSSSKLYNMTEEKNLLNTVPQNDYMNNGSLSQVDEMYSGLCARSKAASILAEIAENRLLSNASRKSALVILFYCYRAENLLS